ncbi:eisosome protein 1 [Kocuria dechangensis]|nr:eisosome protein 1 [Kocuria dechangensis]
MRLALPAREPSGTVPSPASSPGLWESMQESAQESVQRQETAISATTAPGSVPPDGSTTAVQREAAVAAQDSRSTTVPAGPGAVPGPPGGTGMSPEQIDELAQRLVAPIVRRIKADMLLDRERRGLRTDVS